MLFRSVSQSRYCGVGVLTAGRPFVGTNTSTNPIEFGTRADSDVVIVRNSAAIAYFGPNEAGYGSLSVGTGAAGTVGAGTIGKLTVQEDLNSTYWGNSASIVLSNRNYGTNGNIAGGVFVSTFRDVVARHVPSGIWFTRINNAGVSVASDIVFGQSYPYNESSTMPTYRGSMQASTGNFYWGCANTVATAGVGTGNGIFAVQLSVGGSSDDNLYIRRETSGGQYCLQTTSSGSNTGLLRLQPYGGTVVVNNTSNPSGLPLDVYGDIHVGVGSENRGIYFGPWGFTPSIRYNGDGNFDIAARANYGIVFRYETGSSTILGFVDRYGNIGTSGLTGLGTTGGFVQMIGPGYTSSPHLQVGHASGVTSGNYYANFQYAGSIIGSITQSGTTGVNYVTNSDYRLKEDPQPIPDVIARFKKLKPYQYRWKSSGELDEGFFAHELAESCSNAVTGEKDAVNEDGSIKPQSVDYGRITPFLSAVMANMLDRIEQLEARLTQEGK